MNKKGFTLIELLVVIAIIGILSGIVLTSLGSARNKAKIASAQSSISSMRSQAELGVGSGGTYVANLCASTAAGGLDTLWDAVNSQIGNANTECAFTGNATVGSSNWAFVANFEAVTAGAGYYCADSTGYSGSVTDMGNINGNASVGQNNSSDAVCL